MSVQDHPLFGTLYTARALRRFKPDAIPEEVGSISRSGSRVESSNYKGTVHSSVKNGAGFADTSSSYHNNYPVSLFPSIFLSEKLKGNQELQLNYSRRINRPNFFQLFPFTDYSDSLNLSRGNPNLRPEFTNSLELSYQKTFPKSNSLLLSVYYKYTTDLITRYQSQEETRSQILLFL